MAIFRRRRQRTPEPPPVAPGPRPPSPTEALGAHLREIAAIAAAPEEALEPALRAILEGSRADAGAICVFDPRHAILRLVAEVGLSDEGCRRLRSVRRGDPSAWDMPLQGLLNRRAYLIESAARNRYVPRLVEHPASMRTIACLPLYRGPSPIGSLILVTLSPRSLGERDIRMLERGIGELGSMIEAVRRRVGALDEQAVPVPVPSRPAAGLTEAVAERDRLRDEVTARVAERAVLAAELAARTGETERLRTALEAAERERARLGNEIERVRRDADRATVLASSLETAERERARLAEAFEAAVAEQAERARTELALGEARAAAERAASSARAELEAARQTVAAARLDATAREVEVTAEAERLQARIQQAEGAIARERAAGHEREQERARLALELRTAAERERRLREDLEAASGRAAAGDETAMRHALETVRRAEEARAAAAAEAEAVHAQLSSAQEVVLALEDEAARANAEIERLLAGARATSAEYDRLEIGLAEGRARELAATARVAELVREVDALSQDRTRLASVAAEREAEVAGLVARLESVAAERDRVRLALTGAEAERDRVAAEAMGAASAQTGSDDALAREAAERARLTAALGTAQAALGELEATLSRREAEAAEQAAEIARLRAEHERVLAERAPAPETAPAPPAREPVRVVTVGAAAGSRARPREQDAARRLVAVLDLDGTWGNLRVDEHEVAVLAPADDLAEQLAVLQPARIVANLAVPGALAALAALREAGSSARFWGCIADAGADRALPLGMVEPSAAPLDTDAIVEVLARYAVRGTRVVTAGADVDALMSLRQALARRGMSVSMAWDAKQASDLLLVVRPEVVILDLALPRRDGAAVLARLGTVDPPPSAVVVPGPEDLATALAAALADPAHTGRTLTLRQLISGFLARAEAAPVERKHRVRVMGRK